MFVSSPQADLIIFCVHVCAGNLKKPEGGTGSLVLEFQAAVSCPAWEMGPNWGPLCEQEVLLTADPALQSLICILRPLG